MRSSDHPNYAELPHSPTRFRGSALRMTLVVAISFAAQSCTTASSQDPFGGPGNTDNRGGNAGNPGTDNTDDANASDGLDVFGNAGDGAFITFGPVEAERVELSGEAPIESEGLMIPLQMAWQITSEEAIESPWVAQLQGGIRRPVQRGDRLFLVFAARCLKSRQESGECVSEVVFEQMGDPWTKSMTYPIRAGRSWQIFEVPFESAADYAAGEANVGFRLGYENQTLQFAGISLRNYKRTRDLKSFPRTRVTYAGQEPDAAWRAAAQERIESHRKSDLTVRVESGDGQPLEGAEVHINLDRHAFAFGTAINAPFLLSGTPASDRSRYREELVRLFNSSVIENALKWPPLAGDWGSGWGLSVADNAVDWLQDAGLSVRGHVMVWPGWRNLPKSLRALYDDDTTNNNTLAQAVLDHVEELGSHFEGRLSEWDVLNEPFDNNDLMEILGDDVMADWFEQAKKSTQARLFINDYAILSGGAGETAHRAHYEATIRAIIESGAPLEGIGMQGHFGLAVTAPTDVLDLLDRYAAFDKPIVITEYDIVGDDDELAARYTRDFLTVIFSHPAVEGFLMWGFWDGAHWHQDAPLFNKDWTAKPALAAYEELVLQQWTTDEKLTTDATGSVTLRGFKGSYSVEVSLEGKTAQRTLQLGDPAEMLTVTLP